MEGSQPRYSLILVLSLFLPFTPLGALKSYFRSSLIPAISSMNVYQLVNRNQFVVPPRLIGSANLTLQNGLRPISAIVNVHEAAGLFPVAPNL